MGIWKKKSTWSFPTTCQTWKKITASFKQVHLQPCLSSEALEKGQDFEEFGIHQRQCWSKPLHELKDAFIDKPRYLVRVKVIKPVDGDKIVWEISTCARISKYARKYRWSVQTCQNGLEMTAWGVHVRADLNLWLWSASWSTRTLEF